jgi:type IV secretion system protein VirB9
MTVPNLSLKGIRGLLLAAVLLSLGITVPARAELTPQPSAGDPRLRIVRYDPNEVVRLEATLGYAITLEFGEGERVENVSIGDSLGWQVTPNRRANLLFLKPVERAGATDMTVVTNLRSYAFDLSVPLRRKRQTADVIFRLRFDYPEPVAVAMDASVLTAPRAPAQPLDVNHAYSFEGSAAGLPVRVFDDGRSTYFVFAEQTDYPAIFAVDGDKKEAVVNISQRDGYVVVDRLARAFVLRRGAAVTRIVNDSFHEDASTQTQLHRRKGR